MTQVVEILSNGRQGPTWVYKVNIMAADDLATQGARASATMMLTELNQDNSVPTRCEIKFDKKL